MLVELAAGLATEASVAILARTYRSARSRFQAERGLPNPAAVWSDGAERLHPTLVALALEPRLPADAATVRRALGSGRVATVARQVAAAVYVEEFDNFRADLESLMSYAIRREVRSESNQEFSEALVAMLASGAQECFSAVDRSTQEGMQVEVLSRAVLLQATLDSIRPSVLADESEVNLADADDEWISEYKRQCARRHGLITPPNTARRTAVSLKSIYVPGRLRSNIDRSEEVSVYGLADILDRHVILGDPGGGKSTATSAIALQLAEDPAARVPLVVTLRDYAPVMATESVVQFLERTLAARYQTSAPPAGLLDRLLRQGVATVLFDGLDELLVPSRRLQMSELVELFSISYPSTEILVTSRRVGYDEAALDPKVFETWSLTQYSVQDVEVYAAKWFGLNFEDLRSDSPDRPLADVIAGFMRESDSIRDLRSNPLLLALLCAIYKGHNYLPRNRVGIYEKCAEFLFETWDRSREITFDFDFALHIDSALKHLAYWMLVSDVDGDGVTEARLVAEIESFFRSAYDLPARSLRAAQEFIGYCKGRAWVLVELGLTSDGEPRFGFAHRTFLEYYAALQVTRKYPDPSKLARALVKHVSRGEWDTVGQLAVQIADKNVDRGAERSLGAMIRSASGANRSLPYQFNVVSFVVRCLLDMPTYPALLREVHAWCLSLLESQFENPDARVSEAEAARILVQLYVFDDGGEKSLFPDFEGWAKEATEGSVRLDVALFVIVNVFREVSGTSIPALFEKAFLDDRPKVSMAVLFWAYYTGTRSAKEVIAQAVLQGAYPLDPWSSGRRFPGWESSRRGNYAQTIVGFDRMYPEGAPAEWDDGRRWIGTLVEEIGEYLATDWPDGPLFEASIPLARRATRRREATVTLTDYQKIATTVFALAIVESPNFSELVLTSVDGTATATARDARAKGSWPVEGSVGFPPVLADFLEAWSRSEVSVLANHRGSPGAR